MQNKPNQVPVYSKAQRQLHWIVVALVAVQLIMQSPMRDAMLALENTGTLTGTQFLISTLHVWGGVGIGLLVLIRLHLRRKHPVPVGAGRLSHKAGLMVSLMHLSLYSVLLFMVVTGILHYYEIWPAADRGHEIGKWLLAALVVVHTLAGIWHHVILRDTVLRRMLV